ncbi:MAG: hypothetical protein INH43_17760 [Acidobacteriaceae bacterium]|jgi:hypothetical protein|nr:hypothetical protein [Acidobacteriaceae bacterium]
MATEKRFANRKGLARSIRLKWIDAMGRNAFAQAEVKNLGRRGMGVLLRERLQRGSTVYLAERDWPLVGTAVVRYQEDRKGKFYTGLEFSGGLLAPLELIEGDQPA